MAVVMKKSDITRMGWKQVLAKYPRLISCMIDESMGYFTPHAAVNAIVAHKAGEYWGCELYSHIDSCQNPGKMWDDGFDERIKKINHDYISEAFSRRKYYRSEQARYVVQLNLNGKESVGAAWF